MPDDNLMIDTYLDQLVEVIRALPRQPLLDILSLLRAAQREKRQIFVFGNGGSAATASHMVCDLIKNTRSPSRERMKVIGLADNMATLSAYANDEGYERVFAEPLESLGEPGDLAIAISGSGNSPNVLRAVETARRKGLRTVGLTGFAGGKLADMVDVALIAPAGRIEQVEDLHLVIDHLLVICMTEE
ncbi:MAG: SIS domain-containing protein [Anaerolineae bacterium]|jgi:D-sedoheptulose 7-phosphate isomerase|nr:SIS domain-containing protein [Anaerolineae bacterium]MCZ7553581.1 SIS domain-containing protein [Anaerolineales bacterium]